MYQNTTTLSSKQKTAEEKEKAPLKHKRALVMSDMCWTLNHSCVIAYLWQLTSTTVYTSIVVQGADVLLLTKVPGASGVKCSQSISLCLRTGSGLVHNRAYLYVKWIPLQAVDIELHNSICWHIGLQLGCCSFLKPSGHCHSNKLQLRYSWKLFRKKESVSTPNLVFWEYVYQLSHWTLDIGVEDMPCSQG